MCFKARLTSNEQSKGHESNRYRSKSKEQLSGNQRVRRPTHVLDSAWNGSDLLLMRRASSIRLNIAAGMGGAAE